MANDPGNSAISRMIRDFAFEELVNFLKLKLTPDCSNDLVLLCGDFNVFRYPVIEY